MPTIIYMRKWMFITSCHACIIVRRSYTRGHLITTTPRDATTGMVRAASEKAYPTLPTPAARPTQTILPSSSGTIQTRCDTHTSPFPSNSVLACRSTPSITICTIPLSASVPLFPLHHQPLSLIENSIIEIYHR